MKDGEAQDAQDQETAEAEAIPAEDPTPLPGAVAVTATGLFLNNFIEVFGTFKAVAGLQTAKVEPTVALATLAANYAGRYTDIQISQIMASQKGQE